MHLVNCFICRHRPLRAWLLHWQPWRFINQALPRSHTHLGHEKHVQNLWVSGQYLPGAIVAPGSPQVASWVSKQSQAKCPEGNCRCNQQDQHPMMSFPTLLGKAVECHLLPKGYLRSDRQNLQIYPSSQSAEVNSEQMKRKSCRGLVRWVVMFDDRNYVLSISQY